MIQTLNKDALYAKIMAFELDNSTSSLPLSKRLARENGWSLQYALRVIDEYKKFVYLSAKLKRSLTPSDEVDQAWHLHMIYTESYQDFCKILGFYFHHGPTKGGKQESQRFHLQYADTLKEYEKEFGLPPQDIWPEESVRFARTNFVRVDKEQNWVLNKNGFKRYMLNTFAPIIGILAVVSLASGTTNQKDEGFDMGTFLLFLLIAAVGIFLIRGIYRYATRYKRNKRSDSSSGYSSSSKNSDSGCSATNAFFGGGCGSSGCSSSHSSCGSHGGGDSGCGSSGCGSSCGGGGCGGGGCGS